MRIIALGVVISSALLAQGPPPPAPTGELPLGVYRIGNGVGPPRLLNKVEPKYSKEALKARLEGTVLLGVTVGTDGKTRDFRVLRGLGLGLDESAVAAVHTWEFGPGIKDGQPVNVLAQIEVNFRLLDKGSSVKWKLRRLEFHLPDGASRPTIEKVANPHVEDDAATRNVRLTFDIDEKGVPTNVPMEEGANEGFSREMAAALGNWRFKPASKDGHPISVSCTMDFDRGN
jgi:TonB family protein